MSLLTPVKVPVKVYRWDDAGAPALNKTAGCMMTIFKACLVTGYGTKEGAGWTMPFEDTASGVKVFRPEVGLHTDFYLRVSADTGTEMAAQIYLNMTDANTGDLKLQCDSTYKYAKAQNNGKWILIASPRGFWFFTDSSTNETTTIFNQLGSYFFGGDTASAVDSQRAVALMHSGGSNNNYCAGIARRASHDAQFWTQPKTFFESPADISVRTMFDGVTGLTTGIHTAPACYAQQSKLFRFAGAAVSSAGSNLKNYQVVTDAQLGDCIVHSVSTFEPEMWLIGTQFWEY